MFELFSRFSHYVVFDILHLEQSTKLADAVLFFIDDVLKIFFLLSIMVYAIGFIRSFFSPEKVRLWLSGKSRFSAYILAVLLGALTPFCSCSSIPLFIAFLSAGIPLGVTMAFLITSPLINEVAVILLSEAIGLKFTLIYVGTGLLLGVIGGALIDFLKLEKYVESFVWEVKKVDISSQALKGFWWRERFAREEMKDIIKHVWPYVIIGIGLGAALHGYVPREWFLAHAGADNPFAVPLAVLIGIPLYANATGVIPIAEVLIQKGVPIGTILAFIMSIVAISLPEIIILRKVLKPQMLAFFVCFLLIAFVFIGYTFNILFEAS
jgi:hypothetical protein